MKKLIFAAALLCMGFVAKSQTVNNVTTCPIRVESYRLILSSCVKELCPVPVTIPSMDWDNAAACATIGDGFDDIVYRISWDVPGCASVGIDIGSPAITCSPYVFSGTLPACGPCRALVGPGNATVTYTPAAGTINVN